jgi:hypothetical protein
VADARIPDFARVVVSRVIGNPFGPSVAANANAAGGTMVLKRAGL